MALTRDKVIKTLKKCRRKYVSTNTLAKKLRLKKDGKKQLKKIINELIKEGSVVQNKDGKVGWAEKIGILKGKIQRFKEGFGFFLTPEGEEDIFIAPSNMKGALSGDTVLVQVISRRKRRKPEGRVIKVVERAKDRYVGTFYGTARRGEVEPDDPSLPQRIPVAKGKTKNAKDGYKVIFTVVEKRKKLYAEIVSVAGPEDDPNTDLIVVLKKYDLNPEFPPQVEEEVENIEMPEYTPSSHRLDLRDRLIFTIDPVDAKDFDDAISIEKTERGYKLGVHIADVSFFVKAKSATDIEALSRGTSVYLVNFVVPMLPHRLSSNLCSLVPGEDRFTMSVLMEFDHEGNLIKRKFKKSVIRSKARLTYEDAQMLLDGEDLPDDSHSIFASKDNYIKVKEALKHALELAKILRERRWERGSLDFDLPEPEITLYPSGKVASIKPAVRTWSHKLIEEFMIRANEAVAEYFSSRGLPTIYRVHEPPDAEKLKTFLIFAESLLGEKFDIKDITPKTLQQVLVKVEGKPEEALLNYMLLRSLKRARYSVENVGHFGLASENYLHFTSPIRRYPDLVVHRLLKYAIKGKPRKSESWVEYLTYVAERASERERIAERAEFDHIDYKAMDFMKNKIGEIFEGLITHITSNGFFVQLKEFLVEGFVNVDSLGGNYIYDPERYELRETRTQKSFKIGQIVRVMVVKVDKWMKRLDLIIKED